MADKKPFQKKKIQDTQNSGFGGYDEGVGGGASPHGKSAPSDHGHGVNSDYRQANNDTMQPRTGDGKFTYKSVNGQSIDPKYGPSRGKTVNPLLTEGKNGVKIDDVEQQFYNQSGKYWDAYKDKWYREGSMVVTSGDFKTRVAADTVWNVAKRRYDQVKGEFEGEGAVFDETKKGRPSAEMKSAKQKAEATGEEQNVMDQTTGAIKLKPGVVPQAPIQRPAPTPRPTPSPTPGATPGATPIAPSGGTGDQPTASTSSASASQLKHTPEQLSSARNLLTQNGIDLSGVTDEQLDAVVDDYIDFGSDQQDQDATSDQAQAQPQTQTDQSTNEPKEESKEEPEKEEEEESETEKKIKKMGFSE